MKNIVFLLLLIFCGYGLAQNGNVEYEPDPEAPTHEKMFEELFGIPQTDSMLPQIFVSGEPNEFIAEGLFLLWWLSVFAWIAVVILNVVKGIINAPTGKSLLGDNVSTPFAPVRIGLSFFLLMIVPDGRHYSMIEAIILSANKYVSNVANDIYVSSANKIINPSSTLNSRNQSLSVTSENAQNIFKITMCQRYLESVGESENLAFAEINGTSDFEINFGQRINVTIDSFFGLFESSIEGGCGQWYSYVSLPQGVELVTDGDLNQSSFVSNINPQLRLQIIQLITSHRALIQSDLVNEFYALSDEIISRESNDEQNDQYFVDKYKMIISDFNLKATALLRDKMNSQTMIQLMSNEEVGAINDSIRNGWFFAGAMPLALASVHDKYQVFSRTEALATAPVPDNFDDHQDELKEHLGYIDLLFKGDKSQLNPSTSLVNDVARSEIGGYASCVVDLNGLFDCFGHLATLETLNLADGLKSGEQHPLVFTHNVGVSGANSALNAQIGLNTAYIATSFAVGFADGGYFKAGWMSGLAHSAHAMVEMLKSNSGWALKWLMILYTGLGWYVVLMPYIYFVVAIVSYIVMLFVSLLSANFFAVSHAWLEGNGFVSSYAQRGYPSLLFSALNPILIVISFFVYMFSISFIFKYLGYSYEIAITQIVSLSSPNVIGGLVVFTVLVGLIMAVHRILAKLILTVVDRVMRTIGVHEALSSNDFAQAVESTYESNNNEALRGGSDAIERATPPSKGPIESDRSKSDGGSDLSSMETQNSDNQKFTDTASPPSSQEKGSQGFDHSQNINPVSGGQEQSGEGPIQGGNQSGPVIEGGNQSKDVGSTESVGTQGSSGLQQGDKSENNVVMQPHPGNSGITGIASQLGTYVNNALKQNSSNSNNSTSSKSGESNIDSKSELKPEDSKKIDDASEAIREAESFTSKIEDSAASTEQISIDDELNQKPEEHEISSEQEGQDSKQDEHPLDGENNDGDEKT